MGGEEDAKPDRKRQHSLPDRHARDDLINQVGSALSHDGGSLSGGVENPEGAYSGCHSVGLIFGMLTAESIVASLALSR